MGNPWIDQMNTQNMPFYVIFIKTAYFLSPLSAASESRYFLMKTT